MIMTMHGPWLLPQPALLRPLLLPPLLLLLLLRWWWWLPSSSHLEGGVHERLVQVEHQALLAHVVRVRLTQEAHAAAHRRGPLRTHTPQPDSQTGSTGQVPPSSSCLFVAVCVCAWVTHPLGLLVVASAGRGGLGLRVPASSGGGLHLISRVRTHRHAAVTTDTTTLRVQTHERQAGGGGGAAWRHSLALHEGGSERVGSW